MHKSAAIENGNSGFIIKNRGSDTERVESSVFFGEYGRNAVKTGKTEIQNEAPLLTKTNDTYCYNMLKKECGYDTLLKRGCTQKNAAKGRRVCHIFAAMS